MTTCKDSKFDSQVKCASHMEGRRREGRKGERRSGRDSEVKGGEGKGKREEKEEGGNGGGRDMPLNVESYGSASAHYSHQLSSDPSHGQFFITSSVTAGLLFTEGTRRHTTVTHIE